MMKAFKETQPRKAEALNMMRDNNLFNGFLAPWWHSMIDVVATHADGIDLVRALCMFDQHFAKEDRQLNKQSSYGEWIGCVIDTLQHKHNPIDYMENIIQSLIILQGNLGLLNKKLLPEVYAAIKEHPVPQELAEAIIIIARTGLLSFRCPEAERNLKMLASVATVWCGDRHLTRSLQTFPSRLITQKLFDSLVDVSKSPQSPQSIKNCRYEIDALLDEHRYISILGENQQAKHMFACSQTGLFSTRTPRTLKTELPLIENELNSANMSHN